MSDWGTLEGHRSVDRNYAGADRAALCRRAGNGVPSAQPYASAHRRAWRMKDSRLVGEWAFRRALVTD